MKNIEDSVIEHFIDHNIKIINPKQTLFDYIDLKQGFAALFIRFAKILQATESFRLT